MSSILLYHHLGLGDHIMCHGVVREYCKRYDRVGLICKPHNYPSVSFMYRDLQKLTIIKGDDVFARRFIFLNRFKVGKYHYDEVKIIGVENLNKTSNVPLEQQFYDIAEFPLDKKWESFFVERDHKKESALFQQMIRTPNYAFVHEDVNRGYGIKRNHIDQSCTIITPDRKLTDNIFDYCTIIERAKEIHVIDSSFMFLIDCLPYQNPGQKLFVHRYARENPEWQLPILKKNWVVLTA